MGDPERPDVGIRRHEPDRILAVVRDPLLGTFLLGDPGAGAAIYGTYGLVRALGAVVILLGMMKLRTDISDRLIEGYSVVRALAPLQLVFLGVATAIVDGI